MGQRHHGGIWSNQGALSDLNAAYAGFELVDQPQWDVAVAKPAKLADPLEPSRQMLAQISALPADRLKQLSEIPPFRLDRGRARFRLGQFALALEDLDFLVQQDPLSKAHAFLAWTLAALNQPEPSVESLSKYLQLEEDPSRRAYVQIVHAALSGDDEGALAQLDAAAGAFAEDSDGLYFIARAAALAAKTPLGGDDSSASNYIDRAIALLASAVTQGYSDGDYSDDERVASHVDLVALHGDARFLNLLAELGLASQYAALRRADSKFESRLIANTPVDEMVHHVQAMLMDNYRPVAVVVYAASNGDRHLATVVFQRPTQSDEAVEELAVQQAAAAAILFRLGEVGSVWPLLRHVDDSRLRSYVLHNLAKMGADAEQILWRLEIETEVSGQCALILIVGELAHENQLTSDQRSTSTMSLVELYANHPGPSIHAAAEWSLRQLNASSDIANAREMHATGTTIGERLWYVTTTGKHTMVILDAKEPFLMGSPVTESERWQGPTGINEIRHRRLIGRRFAIASHEVTESQYQQFRPDHRSNPSYAREDDAPATIVSWYDAAAYCNWLSEREGLDRDQWCYDPEQDIGVGMTLYPDFLERTGYRLPTEAEWEYACRAGSTTARHFGESDRLLDQYAWYGQNSKGMLPVGSLKPNDSGLFDMHGNAAEWCHDRAFPYKNDRAIMGDSTEMEKLIDFDRRVVRGGWFSSNSAMVRSAHRDNGPADATYISHGFRIARTLSR